MTCEKGPPVVRSLAIPNLQDTPGSWQPYRKEILGSGLISSLWRLACQLTQFSVGFLNSRSIGW